jgi:hypothetical protein
MLAKCSFSCKPEALGDIIRFRILPKTENLF